MTDGIVEAAIAGFVLVVFGLIAVVFVLETRGMNSAWLRDLIPGLAYVMAVFVIIAILVATVFSLFD